MGHEDTILQAIFDHAGLGIALISVDGSLLRVNARYCQMLGYSESELSTKKIWDVTRPPDYDEVSIARRQLLEGAISSHSMEKRYIRKDGTAFWGRLNRSLVRDHDNLPQYFIAVVEDITEKKQAEEALRESEQRMRLAVSTGVGVWEHDLQSRSPALSPQYNRAFGRSPVTPEEWFKLVHPDDRERVLVSIRESISGLNEWSAEFRLLHPDGSIRSMISKGTVLLDDDNRPARLVGVSIDITERKRTEEALRLSQERLELAQEVAGIGTWDWDVKTNETHCSSGYYPLYGLPPGDLAPRLERWLELIYPEDRAHTRAGVERAITSTNHYNEQFRVVWPDGTIHWIYGTGEVFRDNQGNPIRMIGINMDIDERKRAETALRESEDRLRASEARLMEAQHLAKVGSWERHLKSDTIHWSGEMFRILGMADGTPSNFQAFLSYVHPKDREKILEVDDKVRSSAARVEVEYRIIRPDREERFVRSIVEGIRDDQGVPVRIVGATQDITEQVKAGERIRDSEEHLKNAARLAHVGYWQWDPQTNRVSGSDEMFRVFGKPQNYTPSQDDFLQTVIPQDRERVARWLGNCIAEKRGGNIEFQIAWPNGELRTVSSISDLSFGDDGGPTRMFGACQDITDLKRAQQENSARQKLESIGTLARGIAHDFNNLLGGVVAQAEVALGELAAGSRPEEELKAILDGAMRGSEIVRQLMIYAGKDNAAVGLVSVTRIVEEMLELLKVSVSKHAVLETDLGKDLPAVLADAAQLRQIVLNLVTNASEAIGDRDGVIRLTTKCVEGQASTITRGLAEGDYLSLEVSDTGCGISQETQARVFEPFFTTKSSGHGLGLAVVQGIVRGLHGAIHIASEPAKGTTFQVLLPCAETMADANSDPISRTGESARLSPAFTVLVVEDEDPLRQAVVKMLRKRGFQVLEASNGSAAIELLRRDRKIDVILLDVTIPGASSSEVLAEAARARPDTTVVLTSAYSPEMLAPHMSPPHVRGFIRKPFRLDDLVKKLSSALARN